MNYSVDYLFPIPIFSSFITPIDTETRNKILNCEYVREEKSKCFLSLSKYILKEKDFEVLKEETNKKIKIFFRDVLFVNPKINFYISNSWFVIHQKNDYAEIHKHTNSILSGVLYINANENSGDIVFHKPQQHYNLFPDFLEFQFTNYNEINDICWKFTPKNYQILIFPSHLFHHVTPNLSDENRIALAFNVNVKGDFTGDVLNELVIN